MEELFEKFANQINSNMANFEKMLQEMNQKFETKFQQMDERLQEMNQKFETKFQQMDERLQEMDQKFETKFQQMDEKLEKMDQKFETKFQQMDERLEQMDKKFDRLRADNEKFKQEILDRQFVFEQEFGQKINAIYDAVTLELDKNLEKSEKISKLDTRMNRTEVNVFNHETRISKLELGS